MEPLNQYLTHLNTFDLHVFSQRVQAMCGRLQNFYRQDFTSYNPLVFASMLKEIGLASEELQIAVEELHRQNAELASAQQQLEQERTYYKSLFESTSISHIVTTCHGKVVEANEAATCLLNVPHPFLQDKSLLQYVASCDRNEVTTLLQQFCNGAVEPQTRSLPLHLQPRNRQPIQVMVDARRLTAAKTQDTALVRWSIRELSPASAFKREARPIVISSARDPRDVHADGDHDGSRHGDHDGDGSDHDGDGKDANGASPSVEHGSVEHGADWLAACPQRQYFKGEIIPLSSVSIWQVQQGLVKLTTMSESGEEIVIGLVAPGAVFSPHMASLATYQAIALSDASLVQYTIDDLSANVWVNHVLPKLIYRLQQTEALLAVLGRQRVEERLVQMLLLLQKEVGEPQPDGSTRLMVRLTHEDMADICRTSRSTVTRMLGKLQRQGKLRSDEANHLILLPALAGGEKRHQTGSKVSLG